MISQEIFFNIFAICFSLSIIENAKKERDAFVDNIRSITAIMNAELSNIGSNSQQYINKNKDTKNSISDLEKEEKALQESLYKRQISYEEYNEKLAEISQKRIEKEKDLISNPFGVGFLDSAVALFDGIHSKQVENLNKMQEEYDAANEHKLKAEEVLIEKELELEKIKEDIKTAILEEGEANRAEIEERYRQQRLDAEASVEAARLSVSDANNRLNEQSTKLMQQSVIAGTTAMLGSFAQLKKEGASTQKSLLMSLLSGLKASVPVYIAKILAESLSTNPIIGGAIALGANALLYAALGAAESSVSSANFFKGGYVQARNSYEYGIDKIPANITHGEFIFNSNAVKIGRNRKIFEYVNKHNISLDDYYQNDSATQLRYKVIDADTRLQKILVNEMKTNNKILTQMQAEYTKSNKELSGINAHLEEIEASAYRLETADFHKNINIDANVYGDESAFIKKVEFTNKLNNRR